MGQKAVRRWIGAIAVVGGIVTFAMFDTVRAGGNGCIAGEDCPNNPSGLCGYVDLGGGFDYCACFAGGSPTATCDCSTHEYAPCKPKME